MQVILAIICFFLFAPVITAVSQHEDEKNREYKKRRQTERMLRETMEQVRKNGGYY